MKNKLYYQFAGSCFLLVFMFLGYVVRFYPTWLKGFDQTITSFVRRPFPQLNNFFIWYTKFANSLTIIILAIVVIALFIVWKYYAEALWLFINTALIAGVGNSLLKLFFMRQRPTLEHLVTEHMYSFPSGHAVGSTLFYGTILLILPIFIKNKTVRLCVQILLGIGIFMIGVSRIYLGVHFPSDILGGFCLGLAWLLLSYPIYLEKRFVWRFQSKQR
ncbi:TPA: phosphatase PAP2 family protein [Enterococcus faecalis]|uniref:phosphatase PAP2 family protein n=1 Tax=Enterococcus faecalis TaxID=1351 RepID=UPI000A18A96A|nr:phosphatase PAP2 family protein [Enterococcus faecalis]EHV0175033.1 phosphatase PAP2 family protein [Enterococcus faecalis]HBI1932294.1 phosphatase PAP2 family protein [Enterococcus faecalis]HDT8208971.1 phosphatase PAP2 family protein [Enterococcus faecalis]